MVYIICAFKGEARSFIEKRGLKYESGFSHPLYKNKNTLLVISGMGYQNASEATTKLMQYRPLQKNDSIVNIGICAAPEYYSIGSVLVAKELRYKRQSIHIKTTIDHSFKEIILQSVDAVQKQPCSIPVDMEAFGICNTALAHINPNQMLVIKIVSDHFKPESINIKEMIKLIGLKTDEIESMLPS